MVSCQPIAIRLQRIVRGRLRVARSGLAWGNVALTSQINMSKPNARETLIPDSSPSVGTIVRSFGDRGKGSRLRLKFFSWLKPYGLARRDVGHFSRSRITPNAALTRLDHEDAEPTQLDTLAALQSLLHCLEQGFNRYFGFDFRNARLVGNLIHNIKLDHFSLHSRLI